MREQYRRLGRYELLSAIGRGRAFEVFKARSFGVEGFEKKLVVKRVRPELSKDPLFVQAFVEEAQRSVRLSHANVVQVFDLGHDDGEPPEYYMATELVHGTSLDTLLSRLSGAPVPVGLALYVGAEVATALDYAHRRRDEALRPAPVVHGSVSPSQVLLSWEGSVKLSDFGMSRPLLVAREEATGPLESLYAVLSKEQAKGAVPTPACDLYALGLLLYTMLTGQNPFSTPDPKETLARVARGSVPPLSEVRPDVPPNLRDLVGEAMSLDPAARPSDVAEAYERLKALGHVHDLAFGSAELTALLEAHRDPPEQDSDDIDSLLARPVSVQPPVMVPPPSVRPSLPPLAAFAEQRHVSVLVTRFAQPLSEMLRDRAREILSRYGADRIDLRDNELVAVFGLERADGTDTMGAVFAGHIMSRMLSIKDASVGSGITVGHVRADGPGVETLYEEAGDFAEDAEGNVLLSPRAAAHLRHRFELAKAGDGFIVERVARHRGGWDRFVGRKAELGAFAEVLAESSQRGLRVVALSGEQGVGKTRLVEEMRRRLARGKMELATYSASCPPRGVQSPLSGLSVMLRRLAGVTEGDPPERVEAVIPRLRALGLTSDEIDAVLAEIGTTSIQSHFAASGYLIGGFARMLQSLSAERFHVFVWDDAQNLDSATVEVLGSLSSDLESCPLTFVLSGRPDEGAPFRELSVDREISLSEMDAADARRMVAHRLDVEEPPQDVVDFILERAGGHPMFIEELLRGLLDTGALVVAGGRVTHFQSDALTSVPRTLSALISGRLRRLPDLERDVAIAAAVLGSPARMEVLACMLDADQSAVDVAAATLESEEIVERALPGASISFSSPLVPEAILSTLDPEALAELHQHAADGYQRAYPDSLEEEAARIGFHLASAGYRDSAADFYATSGLHHLGLKRFEYGVAEMVYALDLVEFERRGGPQIANWVRALSSAVRHVRTGPDLVGFVSRLSHRVDTYGGFDRRIRVQLAIDLSFILGAVHEYTEAEALLERSASDAEKWPQAARALFAARGEMAAEQGQVARAGKLLARAAQLRPGDAVEQHRILLATARTQAAGGEIDAARATLDEAEKVASETDRVLAAERKRVVAFAAYCARQFEEASEGAYEAATEAAEAGLVYERAASTLLQGLALMRIRDVARAEAAVASATATAEGLGVPRLTGQCRMVLSFLGGDDPDSTSRSALSEALLAAERNQWISDVLLGRYLLARMLAAKGEQDAARRELGATIEVARATGNEAFASDLSHECDDLEGEVGTTGA